MQIGGVLAERIDKVRLGTSEWKRMAYAAVVRPLWERRRRAFHRQWWNNSTNGTIIVAQS